MRHRTPDGNRIVPTQCAPWLGQLETAWEHKLNDKDQWISDVVVAGDWVYMSTDSRDRNVVYIECLNTDGGSLVWQSKFALKYTLDLIVFKGVLFSTVTKMFTVWIDLQEKTLTSQI
ncbi:MAG: hypothetical protein KA140_02630 [Caldisericia bacterium]|nr:hypothetical protein [Caldisericia bacterium]